MILLLLILQATWCLTMVQSYGTSGKSDLWPVLALTTIRTWSPPSQGFVINDSSAWQLACIYDWLVAVSYGQMIMICDLVCWFPTKNTPCTDSLNEHHKNCHKIRSDWFYDCNDLWQKKIPVSAVIVIRGLPVWSFNLISLLYHVPNAEFILE